MENIDYQDGNQVLEATVCKAHQEKKLPTILLFHAWHGKDAFVCNKAKELAKQGYHAIALDTYGKGKLGTSKEENMALMKPFIEDRMKLRKRLLSGVHFAKNLPFVDADRIFVIGFCFGGLCALDVARSNEPIKGAVSFHGLLHPPDQNFSKIHARILAMHGDLDPQVPKEEIAGFKNEMRQRHADWQLIIFGNTYHAFTNPEANDKSFGTIYSRQADLRSFAYLDLFIKESL